MIGIWETIFDSIGGFFGIFEFSQIELKSNRKHLNRPCSLTSQVVCQLLYIYHQPSDNWIFVSELSS